MSWAWVGTGAGLLVGFYLGVMLMSLLTISGIAGE